MEDKDKEIKDNTAKVLAGNLFFLLSSIHLAFIFFNVVVKNGESCLF